jgi:hypothetical protein
VSGFLIGAHCVGRYGHLASPATSGRSSNGCATTSWSSPARISQRGGSCSTSSSRNWPASPRTHDASAPVRVALQNQRDDLLAFAGVLDAKLAAIARAHAISEPLVRETCMLHRLPTTSPVYWQRWSGLRARMGGKFHVLLDAVRRAMADTPRSSTLVENLNSRLRTYFTLRRHLGGAYLDLLRFFLNHRRFLRSRHAERQGKSPRELMTGQGHPHWLTLLGLGPLQPQQA